MRFLIGAFDRLVVAGRDVEAFGLADAVLQRIRFGRVLARLRLLAHVAVDGAEPGVREAEIGIQLNGFAEEGDRRKVASPPPRGQALAVRLERVERRRGRFLNRAS